MIGFFRKIRKQFADDNQFFKYTRYAIGEIVLVIVGILIALQINNWNQIEKSKSESKRLLILLKQDLENDIKYFSTQSAEYNEWLDQIQSILDNTLDGKPKELTRLDQFAAGRSSMNYLHVTKITYLEMFGSGKNLEFDNPEIVRDIKNYFEYADTELVKLNSDNVIFFETLLDYYELSGINTWHRLNKQRNLEYVDWSWLSDPRSKEYMSLEASMLYYEVAIEENLRLMQILESRSKLLIDQIDNSIN